MCYVDVVIMSNVEMEMLRCLMSVWECDSLVIIIDLDALCLYTHPVKSNRLQLFPLVLYE